MWWLPLKLIIMLGTCWLKLHFCEKMCLLLLSTAGLILCQTGAPHCSADDSSSDRLDAYHLFATCCRRAFNVQVLNVAKWRGKQIAQVAQGQGPHVWVELHDLAASLHSITLAQVCSGCLL